MNSSRCLYRETGNPGLIEFAGFQLARRPLADRPQAEAKASLPAAMIELCCALQETR
jgi:hypothetical protein